MTELPYCESQWDKACKVCKGPWKKGTKIYKTAAGHWCVNPNCAPGTGAAAAPTPTTAAPPAQVPTTAPAQAPVWQQCAEGVALDEITKKFVDDNTELLYKINCTVGNRLKELGSLSPNPAMVGQFVNLIWQKMERDSNE